AVGAGERDTGGAMRRGSATATRREGTLPRRLHGKDTAAERPRPLSEVDHAYRERLEQVGLALSGAAPDERLAEYPELTAHLPPLFIGTRAHAEFRSRPTRASPVFKGLVGAALAYADSRVAAKGTK